MKWARTDSRGEYQIWRELLVGDSASPESGTQRSVRHWGKDVLPKKGKQCEHRTRCIKSALTFRHSPLWEQINSAELKSFCREIWMRNARSFTSRRSEDSRKFYPTLTLTHERCLFNSLFWYIFRVAPGMGRLVENVKWGPRV